ncbi:MAG: HAD family phosphatase [Bacteroidetes bacterium]|nr:HAD family phosphatase [Bacteroidota bacterium]
MALPVKAFLFDLNGTMIDDMHYHNKAWFHILNDDLGANMTWDEVKSHMYGKNTELLIRVFGKDHFTLEEMNVLSVEKEKRYQAEMAAKNKNIRMGIGSAAIPFNINFVLDGLDLRHYFDSIVSADDVLESKPDPETYLKGAAELGVLPAECIVFEDAPKGVEASQRAGMRAVVLTTMHEAHEFAAYDNIIQFITDYSALDIEKLV